MGMWRKKRKFTSSFAGLPALLGRTRISSHVFQAMLNFVQFEVWCIVGFCQFSVHEVKQIGVRLTHRKVGGWLSTQFFERRSLNDRLANY